jgi:hypothetical protein
MRTKTLILTAALGTIGAASAMAQVYSVNAVGYINVQMKTGFNLMANQLNTGNNTIAEVIPTVPAGTLAYKFDNQSGYTANTYLFSWSDPAMTIAPGEGLFIATPAADPGFTITLVGEVPQGTLETPLATGFNIVSSQVPQAGAISAVLGYPAAAGDIVYRYVHGTDGDGNATQGYEAYTFLGFWSPSEPEVAVGEAVFVKSIDDKTWTRDFSVNE